MSGHARDREEPSCSSSSSSPPTKKRVVSRKTVEKWVVENDRELNTSVWLKFEGDRNHLFSLKCAVCSEFKDKMGEYEELKRWLFINGRGSQYYRPAFIEGTTNIRTTAFKDHAATDMHAHAMVLFKKQHARNITEYSPIAAALLHLRSMDETTQAQMKRKFDIAYLIAKENMSFTKMKAVCVLEERHGADLGECYKNDRGCSVFVEFIARDQQEQLVAELTRSKFFSLQAEGSTDAGNIEDELFLVLLKECT